MTIKHLVIPGGGPKGFLSVGALEELHDNNIWNINDIESIYATSIGAYISVMIAMKFTWKDIREYMILRPWHECYAINPDRIFNAFQIIRSLDKSLDSNTILALLVVQVRWPSIFWALFKFNLEFDKVWLDCKKKFKDTDYELKYKLSHSLYISLVDNDFSSFYQKFIYKNVPPDSIYKCLNFIGLPIDIEEKQKVEVIR